MGLLNFFDRRTGGLLGKDALGTRKEPYVPARQTERSHPRSDEGGGSDDGSRSVLTRCPAGLIVRKDGEAIGIAGTIEFRNGDFVADGAPRELGGEVDPDWQAKYIDWINEAWTGRAGRYSVTTRIVPGPGGITAYVGNPGIGGAAAEIGGRRIYLQAPDPEGRHVYESRRTGHEVGHVFGNAHGRGLMAPLLDTRIDGGRREEHIDELLRRCGL